MYLEWDSSGWESAVREETVSKGRWLRNEEKCWRLWKFVSSCHITWKLWQRFSTLTRLCVCKIHCLWMKIVEGKMSRGVERMLKFWKLGGMGDWNGVAASVGEIEQLVTVRTESGWTIQADDLRSWVKEHQCRLIGRLDLRLCPEHTFPCVPESSYWISEERKASKCERRQED